MAAGGDQIIEYTTNMGDIYSFSADYTTGGEGWLSWEASASGSVKLTAAGWNGKEAPRSATFHITVGSDDTSTATLDIPVVQLAADDYYYMYGSSAAGLPIESSIQMTKLDKGIYNRVVAVSGDKIVDYDVNVALSMHKTIDRDMSRLYRW